MSKHRRRTSLEVKLLFWFAALVAVLWLISQFTTAL